MQIYRTIRSAKYTPEAQRTDGHENIIGDVTEVRYEECDHIGLCNPIYHYKVGSKKPCFECGKEATSAERAGR